MNIYRFKLEDSVHLWEVDGQIMAMLNPDSTGEVFFQVHPAYRSEELLCEMLDAAEIRLPNQKEDGRRELITWVNAEDLLHKADTQEYLEWMHPRYRREILAELHGGRYSVQDYLDLHGFVLEEAERVVQDFIVKA